MATKVWQGTTGAWDLGANWGGSAPVNDDTVIIGTGSQDITSALNTGLTGITLRIGPGYTGDIGDGTSTPGTGHLDIDGTFDFDGRGTTCYMTGSLTTVTVKGGVSSDTMLSFWSNAITDIGTLRVYGGSGTVTVGANATVDAVEVLGAPGVTVTIAADTSGGGTLTQDSGKVNWSSNMTTVKVRGGLLEVTGTATITTLELDAGTSISGTCRHKASGDITTLTVHGGFFDGRSNPNGSATITTATQYAGTIDLQSGLSNYVLSNGLAVEGDGIFRPSIGTTLTIT